MYEIRADREKHRLYISLGESNGTDMNPLLGEADLACRKLGTGFTCMLHFRRGTLLQPADAVLIFRLQEILCSRGIKKAAYVRQEGSVIGRFQIEMLHINSDCPGEDARSVEEAEALLDQGF